MNQQAAKRPRSDSKILPPPKKKTKKSKSSKSQHSSHSSDKDTNSLEQTATPEGITMTRLLSTLKPLEKSRFKAFRRSTFRGDAISDYVAHCLEASEERAYARNVKSRQLLGATTTEQGKRQQHCPYVKNVDATGSTASAGTPTPSSTQTMTTATRKKRSLQDMVPPGQADEITIVASTLAKNYAQRLVMAARRVASSEGVDESTPLSPQHVLKAYHARVQAGLDPGFFLQKSRKANSVNVESSASVAAALGHVDENALARNAALAAQEEYDKYMKEKGKGEDDDKMDVDETGEVATNKTTSSDAETESAEQKK